MTLDLLVFLADAAPASASGVPDTSGLQNMNMLFMIGFMFLMMYLLMIRPQQKKQKELAAQIASLKTGDKVVTSGGIHGVISNISARAVSSLANSAAHCVRCEVINNDTVCGASSRAVTSTINCIEFCTVAPVNT